MDFVNNLKGMESANKSEASALVGQSIWSSDMSNFKNTIKETTNPNSAVSALPELQIIGLESQPKTSVSDNAQSATVSFADQMQAAQPQDTMSHYFDWGGSNAPPQPEGSALSKIGQSQPPADHLPLTGDVFNKFAQAMENRRIRNAATNQFDLRDALEQKAEDTSKVDLSVGKYNNSELQLTPKADRPAPTEQSGPIDSDGQLDGGGVGNQHNDAPSAEPSNEGAPIDVDNDGVINPPEPQEQAGVDQENEGHIDPIPEAADAEVKPAEEPVRQHGNRRGGGRRRGA